MKYRWIILLVIALTMYSGFRYLIYGSVFRNCAYTEEELPVPAPLQNGTFMLKSGVSIGAGLGAEKEHRCLSYMTSIKNEIVQSGPRSLPPGTSFHLVKVMVVIKHGIGTIDSGPSPIFYLILQDSAGNLYALAHVYLGTDWNWGFISFIDPSGKETILNYGSFEGSTGEDNPYFIYTGEGVGTD